MPPTPEEHAWNTRFRHLTVLFGDAGGGGGACSAATRTGAGVIDPILHTDGADYDKLYVPGTGFKHRPYTDPEQFARGDHIPVMDGRYVFKMATTRMIEVAQRDPGAQRRVRSTTCRMVLMHQANKRINEYCQKALGIPDEKVHPQHRALRQHDRGHHPAAVGRVRARRPHEAGRPRADGRLRRRDELGRDAPARLMGAHHSALEVDTAESRMSIKA